VEEISEGFAAARGLALPSQLRRMLRAQGRDVHGEFLRLLPARPQPIPIQRWSARRVGLLGLVAALVVAIGAPIGTWTLNNDVAVKTPLGTPLQVHNLDCARLEPLWLLAQSVPSASLVPCVQSRLPGWTVANVAVNDGRSVITFDHDRAGAAAVVMRLAAAACETNGTAEQLRQALAQRSHGQLQLDPAAAR
jgi:hypothetical protein